MSLGFLTESEQLQIAINESKAIYDADLRHSFRHQIAQAAAARREAERSKGIPKHPVFTPSTIARQSVAHPTPAATHHSATGAASPRTRSIALSTRTVSNVSRAVTTRRDIEKAQYDLAKIESIRSEGKRIGKEVKAHKREFEQRRKDEAEKKWKAEGEARNLAVEKAALEKAIKRSAKDQEQRRKLEEKEFEDLRMAILASETAKKARDHKSSSPEEAPEWDSRPP